MQIKVVHGEAISPYIPDLARLRITVFRAFPYLYEGSEDYEADYLATYARSPESLFVLALDGERIVGASTGVPMADETEAFKAPFAAAGLAPERIFYYGESVLLADYRGRGLGVRFFEEREAYAARLGRFDWCAFCAVERPADHSLRPADYMPLDTFWKRRGYTPRPDLRTTFSWRDVGEAVETKKPMSFWLKAVI
ncbi:GNAT family N-acetyltransferase [Shinella daejeonensis]|uniref:GNAT family N-acetyltransferase n=1 Tax=Shinella daejeonensis TaxID=659017 RepID=UPI0020C81EF3|nr:GNAT family N-acetyltransferase [Shinella daejeonensis]MCP8893835.1 GNAT family N-acetyltransferase [Shinella daejeonensis]